MRIKRTMVVAATACSAALVASPAAAFTTPRYQMNCQTGYENSTGYGWGRCYAPYPSKWKIRINCRYGFNYDSHWVYSGPEQWYTLRYPANCYFGANSVTIVEGL